MRTSPRSCPAIDLSKHLHYQLVSTLTGRVPPPLDDPPEALGARNHAAVAKVTARLPVNAHETDLAAHRIATPEPGQEDGVAVRLLGGRGRCPSQRRRLAWTRRLKAHVS